MYIFLQRYEDYKKKLSVLSVLSVFVVKFKIVENFFIKNVLRMKNSL